MKKIAIYDTTLRDGMQGEGLSLSLGGKLRLAAKFDEFGFDYVEGGYAGSNIKDMDFFSAARKLELKNTRIAAFGNTRRAGISAAEDLVTRKIIESQAKVATIFGKTWRLHVRDVLRTTETENLAMIKDTVRALKAAECEVIFDAEHFFDGYKDSPEYAFKVLKEAAAAGADCVVLCDTNGGCMPNEIYAITRAAVRAFARLPVGIHCHNDGGMGTANSIEAVRAGATHVQGTMNGYGERCGNANLCSIIPALELKMGCRCLPEGKLRGLKGLSQFVDAVLNILPDRKAPYVGESAFAHKAGMHVNAVQKTPRSFEHVQPELVGNSRRILISELSGGSNILLKALEMGVNIDRASPEVRRVLARLEQKERKGYEFEAADASFRLLMQKVLRKHRPFFGLEGFRVIVEKRGKREACISEATLKIRVGKELSHTVGEGDGPVNALDSALRKALMRFYPQIAAVVLTDYNVRILDPETATAAKTRVLIESSDGESHWGTVGVSENIIEASWEALVDSVEFKLFMDEQKKRQAAAIPQKTLETLPKTK